MTSPPEIDRHYAYFRASGSADVSNLDEILKLSADEQWNVGDSFERRGRSHTRKNSCWRLDSGLGDDKPLSDHLERLLYVLQSKRVALLEMGTEFSLEFVCVSFVYQSFGFELDFQIQRAATNLGVSFSFDSYSFGDLHEEIVELREKLGLRGEL